MAARTRDARRLEPRRPCADHHHLAFRPTRLFDYMRHCRFARSGCVLHAQHIQAVILAIDAIVRADALLDFVFTPVANLDDHMRIGDLCPRHADEVDHPRSQQALRLPCIADALRVHDRNLHDRFDAGGQMNERLRRQRHRRHAVRQRVMRIGARSDHAEIIDEPCLRHRLRDLLQLLVIEPIFMEFVAAHP